MTQTNRQLTFGDDDNRQSISVIVVETFDTTSSYGLYLWPCSPILAQYIWHNRTNFVGKNVLEIGAGTSLPGLVAAKVGAQSVILSDSPTVDKWPSLIRETLALNSMIADRIRIESLDWYDRISIDRFVDKYLPGNVDIILSSDIFFQKKDFEPIIAMLDTLFTHGQPSLQFFATIERRSRSTMLKLNHLLQSWSMTSQVVSLDVFNGDTIYPHIVAGHDILLLGIVKNTPQ